MDMNAQFPEDLESVVRSQIETWKTELEVLMKDPRVIKVTELRQKIDEADTFMDEANAPPLSNPSRPFDPYDAFEFARDLKGREVSTLELSKLAYGRFPEMSDEGRRLMVHYLIENGAAEIARTTVSGRPTWYRFTPGKGGASGIRQRLGIPENELSSFKVDDLEELTARVTEPVLR